MLLFAEKQLVFYMHLQCVIQNAGCVCVCSKVNWLTLTHWLASHRLSLRIDHLHAEWFWRRRRWWCRRLFCVYAGAGRTVQLLGLIQLTCTCIVKGERYLRLDVWTTIDQTIGQPPVNQFSLIYVCDACNSRLSSALFYPLNVSLFSTEHSDVIQINRWEWRMLDRNRNLTKQLNSTETFVHKRSCCCGCIGMVHGVPTSRTSFVHFVSIFFGIKRHSSLVGINSLTAAVVIHIEIGNSRFWQYTNISSISFQFASNSHLIGIAFEHLFCTQWFDGESYSNVNRLICSISCSIPMSMKRISASASTLADDSSWFSSIDSVSSHSRMFGGKRTLEWRNVKQTNECVCTSADGHEPTQSMGDERIHD